MEAVKMKTFIPRADRRPVAMHGYALSETRDSDIQVANLSYGGCALNCPDKLKAGEVVELRVVKRGAIRAEIRWSAEGRAGAQFLS